MLLLAFQGRIFFNVKENAVKFMGKWEFGTSCQENDNLCCGMTERDSHAGERFLVLPTFGAVKLYLCSNFSAFLLYCLLWDIFESVVLN